MVVRLRNKKMMLPRLYQDCIIHVEAISLVEEDYLWSNVQVYVKDLSSMEEFLILYSPSFYWGGKSLSAYMSSHELSAIQEFACILEEKKNYRQHLETSAETKHIEKLMPWLTHSYTVRYLFADKSTFKPSYQHRANAVKLRPKNVKRLDSSASPLFIKRLKTASVYGYLNENGDLVATSGIGWLTKKSFSIGYTETKPEYRGRGIAKCLTSLASEPLIKKGLIGVYAADTTNPASLGVAKALGFQSYGALKCFYN